MQSAHGVAKRVATARAWKSAQAAFMAIIRGLGRRWALRNVTFQFGGDRTDLWFKVRSLMLAALTTGDSDSGDLVVV